MRSVAVRVGKQGPQPEVSSVTVLFVFLPVMKVGQEPLLFPGVPCHMYSIV